MNEVILPPSPNWYFSSILACANDGTVSWGARNAIVVAKPDEESGSLSYSFIDRAHTDRVTTLAFSPEKKDGILRLVSGGDDNVIKIWNLTNLEKEQENTRLDTTHKVVAVDWSKNNKDLIAYVSESRFLVIWNVKCDTSQVINLGFKVKPTCLSCCPHDSFIVSIGITSGLVYIVDIRGSGTIKYKLRGHDRDIVSLSWCPIPVNVLEEDKSTREYLLASGSKDRQIFIWKAGTDGRNQLQLSFPTAPLETTSHKSKVNSSSGNFTSIFWLKPTILLSSLPWGELVSWDLSGNVKKRTPELIHAKHSKGIFAIAAPVYNTKETNENGQVENWRTANDIKSIWTVSQDRQIICCNLINNQTCFDYIITSQGGFVYCLDASPIDTNQIAFGVGDSAIRVWNLSEPNKNILQPQILWEQIKGKVRSLAWHPEKENILAFATNEGRVGTFDIYSKKPPTLYKQYHRHVVYTIGWGPAPDVNGFALYSCGDNELVYYNPEKNNDVPTSVKTKDCTEFCWKSDKSLLAIGFSDGSISFYNRDLSQCGSTMHVLSKPIQDFKWHPISTLADSNISEMQNYLAVAVNSTTITIFDISINNSEDESEKLTFKTVAVLNGHSEKVVSLAWSPHISGYLASGSYDRTVQVWKIHTSGDHEIIASYVSHSAPINCCMWSPLSHDLIITGSIDFSLRIWSISAQKNVLSEIPKIPTRGKRTKKKKTKVEELSKDDTNVVNNEKQEQIKFITSSQNQKEIDEDNTQSLSDSKSIKKKKIKKISHFPGYSQLTLDSKLWCKSIQHLLNFQKSDNCIEQITNGCAKIVVHEEIPPNDSTEIPYFFSSKEDLTESLSQEKKILEQNGHYNICTELDHWSGNLKDNLQKAQKDKHLNDFMVSLAPSISTKFWEELCEAYANQLVFEDSPHKAVSYFLMINKFEEAVNVLRTFKLYKELYALITLRLDSNDPLIKEVLDEWAYQAQKDGDFPSAIACHIKIGNLEKAANLLDRRNDLDSLLLAINVAKVANNPVLTKSLADKAISKALSKNDIDAAKSIIKTNHLIKYREIEVEIFNELNEFQTNVDNNEIYKWLKGEATNLSLLDKISKQFPECPKEYSSLSNVQEVSDSESNITLIQIQASRQIGLSILSSEKKQKIAHLLKAADIIYQFEKSPTEAKRFLLIKYLYAFDTRKFTDCNSIYNYNENKFGGSLRAYLCCALVSWYGLDSQLTSEEKSKMLETLIPILKTYVVDLISKESVMYWTAVNEVKTLDGELSSTMGNFIKSSDEALKEVSTIEKLNLLKTTVAALQAEIVCTPNPMSSYAAMIELIMEININSMQADLLKLVTDTMEQSYSMAKNESPSIVE
ncbi:gem-associated protein 5 [Trichogramma pretiosum]|uniref:gem-associated protein 5 n=1 Tax=Trichogramma pretiosum TaxID=7493 RepID=UPI0006C97FEC|nr:gem-associated protein 5 [Trichogramma pretiosum]XP_014224157.1 gem-associated protein 5 [Trichogramma pretiosum]